jgi:hypothetical protein
MIHYHGLPITPISVLIKAMKGKHALVSFAHPEQIETAVHICQSVVLDNGAFSAWRGGSSVDIPAYTDWAAYWLKSPNVDWCLIPDVIDGNEEDNARLIEEWPLPAVFSVPVWHMHESMDYLRWLMDRFPRIALGSSGQYASVGVRHWWSRMSEAMDVLCDGEGRPLVKIHGLRMLDSDVFSRLPLASADSSSVARNIGIDSAWTGRYSPSTKEVRAQVLIDRIEHKNSAQSWHHSSSGSQIGLFAH